MGEIRFSYTGTYKLLARGTNINDQTLLATDYLNHFNEVIMMLDLVADMPDCLEEAKMWEPRCYKDHFRDSVFSDKELAIFAYDHAPDEYRSAFDQVTTEIDDMVQKGIMEIETVARANEPEALREIVATTTREIQRRMDKASAIINGDFGVEEVEVATMDQSDIDAMFD